MVHVLGGRFLGHLASVLMLALTAVVSAEPTAENYGYPLKDRWAATVVGTPAQLKASLPEDIPLRKHRIRIFDNRELPEAIWYNREMLFTSALRPEADAPVMFLIAGTGAAHNGGKNQFMARAFYQAGYHIVALSSPTYPNFVAAASKTGVPGHVFRDAKDLYRAMDLAWKHVRGSRRAKSFSLAGYSLGGFNAAFVAHLDDTERTFDFERVLLINPPVNLYNSISLLDRMVDNIPGGEDNFDQFFNKVMRVFTDVYKREQDAVGFSEDFLVKVFQAYQPKDEELAALIGLTFRISSGSMIFTSDVMTDFGFIKPSNYEIGRYENLDRFRRIANRVGFTDFYHEFFYPYYAEEYPDLDRDGFIEAMSLSSIADYLRSAEHIYAIHNADDIILERGEINFIRDVFADRARIYPWGGHLGNMEYAENTAYMVSVFQQ